MKCLSLLLFILFLFSISIECVERRKPSAKFMAAKKFRGHSFLATEKSCKSRGTKCGTIRPNCCPGLHCRRKKEINRSLNSAPYRCMP